MLNLDQLFGNDPSCKLDRVYGCISSMRTGNLITIFCLHLHDSESDELGLVKPFTRTVKYESS
jgi:hypothetical protein